MSCEHAAPNGATLEPMPWCAGTPATAEVDLATAAEDSAIHAAVAVGCPSKVDPQASWCHGDSGGSPTTPFPAVEDAPMGVAILEAVAQRLQDFEDQVASRLLSMQRGFDRRFAEVAKKASDESAAFASRVLKEHSGTAALIDGLARDLRQVRSEVQALKELDQLLGPAVTPPPLASSAQQLRGPVLAERERKTHRALGGVGAATMRGRDHDRRESSTESSRTIFSTPASTATARGRECDRGRAEAPAESSRQAERKPTPSGRPEWNSAFVSPSDGDAKRPKAVRQYFSDFTERPVKQIQKAKVELTRAKLSGGRGQDSSSGAVVATLAAGRAGGRGTADMSRRRPSAVANEQRATTPRSHAGGSSRSDGLKAAAFRTLSSRAPQRTAKLQRDLLAVAELQHAGGDSQHVGAALRQGRAHALPRRTKPSASSPSRSPLPSRQATDDEQVSPWYEGHDSRKDLSVGDTVGDWSSDEEDDELLSTEIAASEEARLADMQDDGSDSCESEDMYGDLLPGWSEYTVQTP